MEIDRSHSLNNANPIRHLKRKVHGMGSIDEKEAQRSPELGDMDIQHALWIPDRLKRPKTKRKRNSMHMPERLSPVWGFFFFSCSRDDSPGP